MNAGRAPLSSVREQAESEIEKEHIKANRN